MKDIKPVSQGNQVLKKIMIDLLELQFTMEDNVLLIKELKCFPKEKEKQNTILNTARQQITSIGSVNQLGTTWIQVSDNIESTPATVNIGKINKIWEQVTLYSMNIEQCTEFMNYFWRGLSLDFYGMMGGCLFLLFVTHEHWSGYGGKARRIRIAFIP